MNTATPTLPALTLTTDGRVIDADTGAIVAIDDPAALPATITDALDNYARAKVASDAIAMRIRDRRERLEHELLEPALDADDEHRFDRAALRAAQQVIAETEAALDGYFADRTDKVSFDAGRVLVTWGSPRRTVTLAHPPSWYEDGTAYRQIAQILEPYMITGESKGDAARAVIQWLNPTTKVSAPPAVKLTVRGEVLR